MSQQYTFTKEQITAAIQRWRAKKEHTCAEHVIYNAIRGKSLKHGFTERTSKIQNNNPWFGYTQALLQAQNITSLVNPWERWRDTTRDSIAIRGDALIARRAQEFKDAWGFELTQELETALKQVAE